MSYRYGWDWIVWYCVQEFFQLDQGEMYNLLSRK